VGIRIAISRSTWSVAQNFLNPAKIDRYHAAIKTVHNRCGIMKVMPEKAKKRPIQPRPPARGDAASGPSEPDDHLQ
jgi:hypothetical protein